jgi:RND family efflux transporter MFP subunit
MFKNVVVPLLAAFGFFMGVRTVFLSNQKQPVAQPVVQPASAPFQRFVAGSGIIESASENIAIATPVSGTVEQVHVVVGAAVRIGDPLFTIESRELKAQSEVARANLAVAKRELADAREQYQLWSSVKDRRAVSEEEFIKRKNAVGIFSERVVLAEAQLKAIETEVERRIIRAPIDGKVLQVKVRVGEFAPAQVAATPLMLLGKVEPVLHVRVDVDENDAWRVKDSAQGVAFLRGNTELSVPIQFVRFEPYVLPKRSLTGGSSERVDTRVLQVVYSFSPKELPVFVGQLMDVFIEEK